MIRARLGVKPPPTNRTPDAWAELLYLLCGQAVRVARVSFRDLHTQRGNRIATEKSQKNHRIIAEYHRIIIGYT